MSGYGTTPFGTAPYGTADGSGGVPGPALYTGTLSDTAGASEGFAGEMSTSAYLTASANAFDAQASFLFTILLSSGTASLAATGNHISSLSDTVRAGEQMLGTAALFVNMSAAAAASETLRQLVDAIVADSATAAEAVTTIHKRFALLQDLLRASDPMLTSLDARVLLLAEATTLDLLAIGYDAEALAAGALATEVLSDLLLANAALLDQASATLTDGSFARLMMDVGDSAAGSDALLTVASLFNLLRAGATAAIHLRIGEEDLTAWTLDLDGLGVSEYRNYRFNSMVKVRGRYYGASDTGLYLLEGADDAGTPIDAWVRTGLSNFGTGLLKRMVGAYVGYTADAGLILKVITTSTTTGTKVEHWYRMEPREADGATRENRVKVGRGVEAVYWQFELRNVDGGDFSLDQIELLPMVLTRRVR